MDLAVSIAIGLTVVGSAIVTLPNVLVQLAKHRDPEVVFTVDTREPWVALTIDDGPSSATHEILRVLEENGAKATFFLIGENVDARPAQVQEIASAGHELAHHMMDDRRSKDLPAAVFDEDFDAMARRLEEVGGGRLFRPASGWYDDRMIEVAAASGYRIVLGSIYPFDAQIPSPGFASWYVLQNLAPGAILVLHDGDERGLRTAEALRSLLPELRRRGYRVVTVSSLLEMAATSSPTGP
jgi:peptidoglycan/xylan/chitin deacetylase (PgdA/CDA1 family)